MISRYTFQKSEYKDLCLKYFFLIFNNKSAHSVKIYFSEIIALHATQTGTSSFLRINSVFLYYKGTTGSLKVLVKFCETYLILNLFHPILSVKFDMYIFDI